jgi:hypothetical protein
MAKEISLVLPDSLLSYLDSRAQEQSVSLEALCLSLLEKENQEEKLVEPMFYQSLTHEDIRKEINRVIKSSLPTYEIKKRVNNLESYISRRFVRS